MCICNNMLFAEEEFLEIVARTPLVSIDLVARNADARLLVGHRRNEPAKGGSFQLEGCERMKRYRGIQDNLGG